MNEIERYLDEVCRCLGGSRDLREHVREELRDHLADAVESNVSRGLSKEEATKKAIEDFGRPEETRSGLQALYGRSATSFLIDRAMAWKERTMKSGWKWSFAAMTMLVIVIAGQLLLALASFVFIFPKLRWNYEILGEPFPALPAAALKGARFLHDGPAGLVLLIAVLVAWALFEWRSKSENKAVIRLACAACATLVTTAAFAIMALATTVGLAEVASLNYHQDPRPYALAKVAEADLAVANLRSAVEEGDEVRTFSAASFLLDALINLRTPRSARALVPTKDPQQVQRIQSLVDAMYEQDLRGLNLHDKKALEELTKTWTLLVKEIQYSAGAPAPGGK